MSDWGNDTPVQETNTGWGNDTPVAEEPAYTPDPVIKPPVSFMRRFAENANEENKGLIDAFKAGYGKEPYIAWRPEDVKTLQDWGLLNSPDRPDASFGNLVRSVTNPVLKGLPAIPDTILRGINGLAAMGSEYVGQTLGDLAGGVTGGNAEIRKKVHDTAAGMSWEGIQAWFLYEMSNGAGFGRAPKAPDGVTTVEPIGSLPRQSSFDNVATILGNKEVEPNLKKAYDSQGITPAEIFNDAQKDVTITQDVVTGANKIKAYEGPVTTPSDFVKNDFNFAWTPQEFKQAVKDRGLDHNEVIDYIASQPEVSGRWTDAMNKAAVESRVRDMHPAVYDLYGTLEQKKIDASNYVEELKANKEEAIFGEIDKAIEDTRARLSAEGGQGKRYKVYQQRLEDLQQKRKEMEFASAQGDVTSSFDQNIQAARMEWLKLDQQQRNLAPILGRARRQAEAEIEAVGASDLPIKEDVTPSQVQATQAAQQANAPGGNVPSNAPTQAPQAGGGGAGTVPPGNVTGAPGAAQPAPVPTAAQARANILNKINVGGRDWKEKLSWNRFYTRYFDMFNPVRQAIRDQLKQVGLDYKTIKNTEADPYIWFRLTKGTFGKSNSFLMHGTRNYHSLLVNGMGLKEILKPVADDLNGLRSYIAARRGLELESRGITSGFDVADMQVEVAANRAKFEPVHRALVDYQNRITEYLKDSGLISEQTYSDMLASNQEYTPFYRYFGDRDTPVGKNVSNRLGVKSPIKGIKGSEADIIDPLESVIRNTYAYIALADKNAAGLKLVDLMNHLNSNYLVQVPATPTNGLSNIAQVMQRARGENLIAVWRNGTPELYKVENNPDLVRAWQGLDAYVASDLTKLLALPAKSLRAGATLTPDFMFRNFMRDMTTAFATASSHPLRSAQGFMHAFLKTDAYRDWQASGGSNAAMVSLDRHYLQGNIREILSETSALKHGWNIVNHPVESARALSELFENATRLGAYMRKNPITKAQKLEAAFTSREATLDFARMGTQIRAVNMLDAFINANLQGTDRIVRAFKDDPLGTGVRVAAGITAPSVFLWMANHKDPRYQHAHDYEKNLYWLVMTDNWQPITKAEATAQNIPDWLLRTQNGKLQAQKGYTIKIPKPFELGLMFGSLPERMLDEMYDKNPKAIESWKNDTLAAAIPQLLPQFIGVPVEGITNHSFFTGQPLVPDHLKGLLPEYQYTEYTSETAKLIGKMVGAIPGMRDAEVNPNAPLNGLAQQITSPMILENYVQGWAGGLGMQALKVADAGLKMAGIEADKIVPDTPLEQIPFIKSFFIRYPQANPQSVSDFRAHNDKNKMIMDSIKSRVKAQDMQEYDKLLNQFGIRATLDKTQEAINKQYRLIQAIYNTNGINKETGKPIYTSTDKRQLIDSLYFSIDQMATQANQMLNQEDKFIAEYKDK